VDEKATVRVVEGGNRIDLYSYPGRNPYTREDVTILSLRDAEDLRADLDKAINKVKQRFDYDGDVIIKNPIPGEDIRIVVKHCPECSGWFDEGDEKEVIFVNGECTSCHIGP